MTAWWACHAGTSIASWLVRIGGRSSLSTLEEMLVIRRLEGFARTWERGILVPQTPVPAWGQAVIDGPINPQAPAAWPDVAGALAAAVANGETPVAALPVAPPEDPRTIETVVVSTAGPLAPPSPPPPG